MKAYLNHLRVFVIISLGLIMLFTNHFFVYFSVRSMVDLEADHTTMENEKISSRLKHLCGRLQSSYEVNMLATSFLVFVGLLPYVKYSAPLYFRKKRNV
jgi:hypothetical protein